MIHLYCDGGCSGNQTSENIGGWGTVLVYREHIKELKGGEFNTTNNRMELTALIEGLRAIQNTAKPVSVYSDSAYIVNCFHQKWHINWQKNGWKNSKKEPVENQDLWQELLDLVARHPQVHFFKVKGHLDPQDQGAMKRWHAKFVTDYGVDMPFDRYQESVQYNNRADQLANEAIDALRKAGRP